MDNVQSSENPPIQQPVFLIETEKISVNPYQPRREFNEEALKELANSIREFGILQPLVVTKIEEDVETGTKVRYELIAGERRLRAAHILGLERVPAIIRSVQLDRERLEMAIVENVQRANLNAIESARAYARLQDEFRLTQREIATRIGKSREVIANTMRLLNLPSLMQEAVSKGDLSESQARLLLSLENPTQQQKLFEEILKNHLSVRELKAKIEYFKNQTAPAQPGEVGSIDPEAAALQKELEEALGTPVKLERSGATGKITIAFYSPEELRAIIAKIAVKNQPASPDASPTNESKQASQGGPLLQAPSEQLPENFSI